MLLFFAFSIVNSYVLTCQSPTEHAPGYSNLTLISFSMVTRHGMRTPMDSYSSRELNGFWMCDDSSAQSPRMHVSNSNGTMRRYQRVQDPKYVEFPPNCDEGELILRGMEQHLELGQFYRKFLVDEIHFLPPYLDQSNIRIRASKVERCIRSAVSFLNGLYPPASPGERIQIITGTSGSEFLYPSSGGCDDLRNTWNQFVSSTEFQNRMNSSKELYAEIYQKLKLTPDLTNWMFLGDWMTSYLCTNQTLPLVDPLPDNIIQQSLKDIAYFSYGFFNTQRAVAASPIWRHIFRDIDDFLAMKPGSGKFQLYSAHDTTIIALLVSLGYVDEKLPPFRSHFAIELWRDTKSVLYIRFVFNGQPVGIDFMNNQTLVEYSVLKGKMAQRGDLNYCLKEFP